METESNINQTQKAKKNLLWFGIFSIIMLFGGLTSAYIVSKGSTFWVKFALPDAFIISTVVIILSSGCLFLALRFVRQGKTSQPKALLGLALFFGLLFGYFQWQGWQTLVKNGNTVTAAIMNQNGRYGQFYTMTYQGKEITYDGYDFYWSGEKLSEELTEKIKNFSQKLVDGADYRKKEQHYELENYGTDFILFYDQTPLAYADQKLTLNGVPLSAVYRERLFKFAECLVLGRGDFIMAGRYGEDFVIRYKGEELEYVNRTFLLDGHRLSAKQENDLQGSRNTSSSFTYVFTGLHFLHWIGGVIALLVIWIRSIQVHYSAQENLGIQLASTYWHFLGILWLYLYAFLIFIH